MLTFSVIKADGDINMCTSLNCWVCVFLYVLQVIRRFLSCIWVDHVQFTGRASQLKTQKFGISSTHWCVPKGLTLLLCQYVKHITCAIQTHTHRPEISLHTNTHIHLETLWEGLSSVQASLARSELTAFSCCCCCCCCCRRVKQLNVIQLTSTLLDYLLSFPWNKPTAVMWTEFRADCWSNLRTPLGSCPTSVDETWHVSLVWKELL